MTQKQNPFWDLVNTARTVDSQHYQNSSDEQHDLWEAVRHISPDLTPKEFTNAFFRLVPDVLEKRIAPQSVFFVADAAASEARDRRGREGLSEEEERDLRGLYSLRNTAHRVAAVAKAVNEELLTMPELAELGLAEQRSKPGDSNGYYWHAFVGKHAVREAADKLAEQGRHSGASILRICLIRGARGANASEEVQELSKQVKQSIRALRSEQEYDAAQDLFAELQQAVSMAEGRAKKREENEAEQELEASA